MRSQVAGLASVGDLRVKKVLRTAVDLVGYRNDQLDPFSRCHLAPWPTKRRSCRRHCVGDVGFASLMNRAGRLPGCRVDVGKGLSLARSEEHTSELQSLMRISYAVFCLKKKNHKKREHI